MIGEERKTLLLVEDEIILALNEKMQPEKYGHAITMANTGAKAISLCKDNKAIDLVLMDIDLGPGMDGTEAAQAILDFRTIPISFMSSHTEPEIAEKTEKITSFGYVAKSSSITVLDASIKMAFKLFQANRRIHEKETIIKAAMESMTDAVFISDTSGRFVEFNDAFASFHRFGNKAECATTLAEYPDIVTVRRTDGVRAELDMWAVSRALRGETVTNEEYIISRKDSGETWIGSYNFSPIRDETGTIVGSVVVARDITKLRKAEETIRETDIRIRKLFSAVPDLIFQFTRRPDGSYCVPLASEGIRNIFGCAPEDVLEDFGPIGRVLHPADMDRVVADIEYSARTLCYFTCEFRVQRGHNRSQAC